MSASPWTSSSATAARCACARPARDDADALLEFFARALAAEPVPALPRLAGASTPQLVEPLLEPDWAGARLPWSASRRGRADRRARELRRACATRRAPRSRSPSPTSYQGRGIGTRLLEQLAARAAGAGIERFVAEVLPDNRAMLRVFETAGFEVTRELEGGEVEVTFPIAPTERYREHVDARDHVAVAASLRAFFEPTAVAVVGASPRRGSIGGELFRNILDARLHGRRLSRQPQAASRSPASAATRRSRRSRTTVDLAVICVPGEHVLDGRRGRRCAAGVRALCVISAGFAEIGPEGVERQEQLLALVRAHGARLIGPNCLGIASAGPRLNATFAPRALPRRERSASRRRAARSASRCSRRRKRAGSGSPRSSRSATRPTSRRTTCSSGGRTTTATDLVAALPRVVRQPAQVRAHRAPGGAHEADPRDEERPHARRREGRRLAHRGARRLRRRRRRALPPGRRIRARHARGARRRRRRCSRRQPLPRGRRVAVLTNAGGLGILCADACEAAGLELPVARRRDARARSPSSCRARQASRTRSTCSARRPARRYEAALPLVLADPRVDAVIVLFVPPVSATADEVARGGRRGVARSAADKPVLAVVISAEGTPAALRERRRVAAFAYPGVGRARARPRRRARRVAARAPRAPSRSSTGSTARRRAARRRDALRAVDDVWLEADAGAGAARAYGIPLVAERRRGGRRRGGRGGARARLPGRRQDRRAPARTRPRRAASRSTSPTRRQCARRPSGSAAPVLVQPMVARRRRAARRRRPGSGLRPARRVRAGRRLRRADRRRAVPDRAAHRRRRARSSSTSGKAGAARRGFRGHAALPTRRARRPAARLSAGSPTTSRRSPSSTSTRCSRPRRLRRGRRARPRARGRADAQSAKTW